MGHQRKPVSFIATADAARAKAFYCDVLGLELVEESPFALVLDDGGGVLRIQIVPEVAAAGYTAHGWEVARMDDEIEMLAAKGVSLLRFAQLPQDDRGVWTSPDGHKIAWFSDPCGNMLSLTELA